METKPLTNEESGQPDIVPGENSPLGSLDSQASTLTYLKSLPVHPVAEIYPLVRGEDFSNLVSSIQQNGLKNPIVIGEDEAGTVWLVDGRNRLRACEEAGVQPAYIKLENGHSAENAIMAFNNSRRDLNPSQRAAVALDYTEYLETERKRNPQKIADLVGVESREYAAKMFRTNHTYISTLRKIKDHDFRLFRDVKKGKLTLSQAKNKMQADARNNEVRKIRRVPHPIHLEHTPLMEFIAQLSKQSVDLVITEFYCADRSKIEFSWFCELSEKMKPTGHMYFVVGSDPGEVRHFLTKLSDFSSPFEVKNILPWNCLVGPKMSTGYSHYKIILRLSSPISTPLTTKSGKAFDPIICTPTVDEISKLELLGGLLTRQCTKSGDFVCDPFSDPDAHLLRGAAFADRKIIGRVSDQDGPRHRGTEGGGI